MEISNGLNEALDKAKRTPIKQVPISQKNERELTDIISLKKKFLEKVRRLRDKKELLKKQLPYPEGTVFQLGRLKVMLVRKTEYDVVDYYFIKKLGSTCMGCHFNKMIIEESFDMGGNHRLERLHCCLEDKIYEELLGRENLIEIPAEFRVEIDDYTHGKNSKCVGFQFKEIK